MQAGQLLSKFESPDLVARQQRIKTTEHALEQRLAGIMADDRHGHRSRQPLLQRLYEQKAELLAIAEEVERLHIAAEFTGRWMDVDPLLRVGGWINAKEPLGILIDPHNWVVDAYIEHHDIARIQSGAKARFYPAGQDYSVAARVIFIDTARTQRPLPQPLDARFGGQVMTQEQEAEAGVPLIAHYRVRLQLDQPLASGKMAQIKGMAHIQGERRSLLWEWAKGVTALLIEESGF